MLDLDRYIIDDGLHLPKLVIDEDASTAAGEARFRAECSCDRAPDPAGTREEALAAHLAHVNTRTGPSRGPAWLPVGPRIAILLVTMMAIWTTCFVTGHVITQAQGFTGGAATAVLAVSLVTGFLLAFGLMVAARHFIAPTRA